MRPIAHWCCTARSAPAIGVGFLAGEVQACRWRHSQAIRRVLPPGATNVDSPGDAVTALPQRHKTRIRWSKARSGPPSLRVKPLGEPHSRGFAPPGPTWGHHENRCDHRFTSTVQRNIPIAPYLLPSPTHGGGGGGRGSFDDARLCGAPEGDLPAASDAHAGVPSFKQLRPRPLEATMTVGGPRRPIWTPPPCSSISTSSNRTSPGWPASSEEHGVGWRPHTKAIKIPAIAYKLLAAGAHGVTVAKLSEAEIMAAAGITRHPDHRAGRRRAQGGPARQPLEAGQSDRRGRLRRARRHAGQGRPGVRRPDPDRRRG